MAGEWLTATANTNMFTYEIAPVFILMENVVMTHMREIIGSCWRNGDSILAPGIRELIYRSKISTYMYLNKSNVTSLLTFKHAYTRRYNY